MRGSLTLLTGSWGLLGCFLGPPGVILGPRGASWGALGGVLGALGVLLGRLGGDPKQLKNRMQNNTDFGSLNAPYHNYFRGGVGEPKSTKSYTQNETNFKTMFKSEKVALQEPLGAVLGRSWAPPTFKIVLWLERRSFLQKSCVFNKSHLEAELGRQKCRK